MGSIAYLNLSAKLSVDRLPMLILNNRSLLARCWRFFRHKLERACWIRLNHTHFCDPSKIAFQAHQCAIHGSRFQPQHLCDRFQRQFQCRSRGSPLSPPFAFARSTTIKEQVDTYNCILPHLVYSTVCRTSTPNAIVLII
jgi:hypothetical protein